MNTESAERICERVLKGDRIGFEDALHLWEHAPVRLLMAYADEIRRKMHPGGRVGWIIDRNVNITNICMSMCRFCNFCRPRNLSEAYVLGLEEYRPRIRELMELGGKQLLLQGGMHPELGIDFYTSLFSALKAEFPDLKLHALGPPEIVHIARLESMDYEEVLQKLVAAGLDSLPGAGAEILSDRVRNILSPKKCSSAEWLEVMRVAHSMNLVTSATMMFGHIETIEERIQHLFLIRETQSLKPASAPGFLSFIPWPFQHVNTVLNLKNGISNSVGPVEYIRWIALSRIVLDNIPNLQASWLTVGRETGQLCLHAGANDFGSIMIEEKVVALAGAHHRFDAAGICEAIREAGFTPAQRDQAFHYL